MDLDTLLANGLVTAHPLEAAQALERIPARDAAALLEELEVEASAGVLQRMNSHSAAGVVTALADANTCEIFERLSTPTAALVLRHVNAAVRERLLASLPRRRARGLGSVLDFPANTAGSLMDPEVLGIPHDLTVEEAIARVREAARDARYNVYVVDRDQVLVGVINLRELLMAEPGDQISALMKTDVHRLSARADRRMVVSHPGWREVHALPVVDDHGRYLGAVRYRTLRRLEEGLRSNLPDEGATARALGDLLRAGASAMLEAVVASTSPDRGSLEPGRSADGA